MSIEAEGQSNPKQKAEGGVTTLEAKSEKGTTFTEAPPNIRLLNVMWETQGGKFNASSSMIEITPDLIQKEAEPYKASFNKMVEIFQENRRRVDAGEPALINSKPNDLVWRGGEAEFRMRIAIGFAYMFAKKHGITKGAEVGMDQNLSGHNQSLDYKLTFLGSSSNGGRRIKQEVLDPAEKAYKPLERKDPSDDEGRGPLYEIRVRDEFLKQMDAF